jgi:hypothetical protein
MTRMGDSAMPRTHNPEKFGLPLPANLSEVAGTSTGPDTRPALVVTTRTGKHAQVVTLTSALGAAAALVAVIFALTTFERWRITRKPHQAAWSISLVLFALAAGGLWLAGAQGWDVATFKWFFYFGAIANVPVLALGSLYLLAGKKWGHPVALVTAMALSFAAGIIIISPTKAALPASGLPKGKEVFGWWPRGLAAFGSALPAMFIIGGALWSVVRLTRGRAPRRLVTANLLIMLGTLTLSASGTLAGRLGEEKAFAVTLVIGVCILFAGFLTASNSPTGEQRAGASGRPSSDPTSIHS